MGWAYEEPSHSVSTTALEVKGRVSMAAAGPHLGLAAGAVQISLVAVNVSLAFDLPRPPSRFSDLGSQLARQLREVRQLEYGISVWQKCGKILVYGLVCAGLCGRLEGNARA